MSELNRDLGKRYGLPVEFSAKVDGLDAIARALCRGDQLHARIATLHLRIPDPPPLGKATQNPSEIINLACRLKASDLLKADWNPAKHPRWPAGSPDSVGGQFAPSGGTMGDAAARNTNASAAVAQLTIPVPFELPIPGTIPFPSEIIPPPVIPDVSPRDVPRNPYPDRPECEQEWAEAVKYCDELRRRGLLGKDGYRGMGSYFYQCILGQVSEDCGGNPVDRS